MNITQLHSWCRRLLIVGLCIGTSVYARAEDKPPVTSALATGFLELATQEAKLKETTSKINALLTTFLSAQDSLFLVERAELDKAVGELELGNSGTVSPDSAAKIGYLTGAKVLVSGKVFSVDAQLFMVAKIIGTETGRIYGETETMAIADSPSEAAQKLAQKIGTAIQTKGGTLVAQVAAEKDVVATLAPLVAGKKLPSVTISLVESSTLSSSQTTRRTLRLREILEQLGFRVLDKDSANEKAELLVKGSAFAERGMQRGNLVSGKGRIELSLSKSATGQLLFADSATDVAVDLSPDLAGKMALERAARKLALRLVPKMVEK